MFVVWLSPGGSVRFTGISWDAEICPGFPPPQAALVTVASGEKELWVVWCNSGEVMLRLRGRGTLICMIRVMVGGGHYCATGRGVVTDTGTRGLKRGCPMKDGKIYNKLK